LKQKITLEFSCDQDWNAMTPTENGRYCAVCQKNVVDYSHLSLKELMLERENQELCGNFRMEQVNLDLIKPIEFPRPVKAAVFLSLFSLMSNNSKLQANVLFKTKIELVETISTSTPIDSVKKANVKQQENKRVPMHRLFSTKKKVYFWSRKFPFIHASKRFLRGKIKGPNRNV
jgi:hypothetical protein